jgi:hypothetical protein
MIIHRIAFGVTVLALGIASAASSHKVKLESPLFIGTTELKAGEYRVEMQGDKAVFKSGKTVIEVPATVSKAEHNYRLTSVVTEGTKLQEIDFGGTTESLLFNANGSSAAGTK